jgi:hypothetical protein
LRQNCFGKGGKGAYRLGYREIEPAWRRYMKLLRRPTSSAFHELTIGDRESMGATSKPFKQEKKPGDFIPAFRIDSEQQSHH